MPRQFGQSPLAFALQQALQQGGGLVGSIPALKMQNQEFANQQQGFEQGQLAQMLSMVLSQRADQRAERGMGLREREFQLGIGDRERALDNANMEAESQGILARNLSQLIQAQQQGRPFDPNQVSRVLTLDPKLGNNLLGAATSSRRETRLDRNPTTAGVTPAQTRSLVDQRLDVQRQGVLDRASNASGFDERSRGDLAAFADEGLARESGGFMGFFKNPNPDSTGVRLLNQYDQIGTPANRAATRDSLPQLYPDFFGGSGRAGGNPVTDIVNQLRSAGVKVLDVQDVADLRAEGYSDDEIEQIRQALK